jgi:uncharacterized lipoprotein YajG
MLSNKPAKLCRYLVIAASASLMLAGCAQEAPAPTVILKHLPPVPVPSELMAPAIPAKCETIKGKVPVSVLERDRNCIHKDRERIANEKNALIEAVQVRQESASH